MIRRLLHAGVAGAVSPRFFGQLTAQMGTSEVTDSQREAMSGLAREFMEKFSVPALSLAIARRGRLVYEYPFGTADRAAQKELSMPDLFRIASVSKPITAVAIFKLVEQGRLNLSDRVFGDSGVLGSGFGKPPFERHVADITVDHLLTHTSGGWPNDSTDPMFRFKTWNHARLISWTLGNLPLTHPPGEHWAYSNFGYCLLGRIVEKVTGLPYDAYVRESILAPCGINAMRLAGNTRRQRAPGEVVYHGQDGENPYDLNVRRMDSHGGWLASSSDLVRFLTQLDGSSAAPALLRPETIRIMTTPSPAYPPGAARYARGWMVREEGKGNWWHNGSLPGTTTIMVRTAGGLSWAALTNTRRKPMNEIGGALDALVWNMARQVPAWNA